MADKLLDLEVFLSEADRKACINARQFYADSPELAERLAKLVKEIRSVKKEVVRAVQSAATAA